MKGGGCKWISSRLGGAPHYLPMSLTGFAGHMNVQKIKLDNSICPNRASHLHCGVL